MLKLVRQFLAEKNLLADNQNARLVDLVDVSTGDTSIAAARAHGALTLPTSDSVKQILK